MFWGNAPDFALGFDLFTLHPQSLLQDPVNEQSVTSLIWLHPKRGGIFGKRAIQEACLSVCFFHHCWEVNSKNMSYTGQRKQFAKMIPARKVKAQPSKKKECLKHVFLYCCYLGRQREWKRIHAS